MIQSFSWNQTSHYDLIRSLDADSTTIDAYQENTGDKVFYKGHWYSARAPGLALFSLPFYDTLKGARRRRVARSSRSAARRRRDDLLRSACGATCCPASCCCCSCGASPSASSPATAPPPRSIARARHDGAAALDAAVLARLHRVPRLRRVRADAARARRAAAPVAARRSPGWRSATRSPRSTRCSSSALVLGLYLLSRRDALQPARRAHARAGAYIARRPRRDRAAAALQPLRRSTPGRTWPTPTSRASRKASSASAPRA